MAQHLTVEERKVLYKLRKSGKKVVEISAVMQRDRSTIYREIRRNTGACGYRPKQAQRLADARRAACRRPHKMKDPETHRYVHDRLLKLWSPDQIAAFSRREFPRRPQRRLSRQTIYNWIKTHCRGWRTLLRRHGRSKEKRGKLKDCVRIDGRPDVINQRCRYGDWEGDTIVSAYRRSGLLTLVERKSGFTRLGLVDTLKSSTTMKMAERRLQKLPECLRRSMTFDNGKEFAEHRYLTDKLGMDIYFAAPYSSWQRGTNENTNGLLRQFFPKGTDFARISHQEVARVEKLLNERPRRRLGYRTPSEVLAKKMRCN